MYCLTDKGLLERWDLRQLSAEPDTHLSAYVSRLKFHNQTSNAALRLRPSNLLAAFIWFFILGGIVYSL